MCKEYLIPLFFQPCLKQVQIDTNPHMYRMWNPILPISICKQWLVPPIHKVFPVE